ncbi:MAG: cytochrome c biogenesis protein ResB [Kiritimatiellia bacterium]
MRAGLVILSMLALLVLAGAVPVRDGAQTAVFSSPVFLIVAAALSVSLAACSFRQRRDIPFLLCHAGIILILAGAFARFIRGEFYEVTIPVTPSHRALNLQMPDGEKRPLGFGLSVVDFSVDFYPPVYRLIRSDEEPDEFVLEDDGFIDLPGHGRINASELKLPGVQGWKPVHELPDGSRVELKMLKPKHYEARLEFSMPDDTSEQASLAVNHPVCHGGWWFHLESYDPRAGRFVILKIKRDPGLRAVKGGIWMAMIGTFGLCFRRRRP